MTRKVLLICGILASLVYVGSDILAALHWEGYSYLDQSVSELRAIGAPTRPFLVPILTVYTLLEIAFGVGVWISAGPKRALRITGGLLVALGVLDLTAYFFPMHLREEISQTGRTLTETMHLIGTGVTVLLILLIIGFGAAANGKSFRLYSYATILVLILAGAWGALDAPRIEANLPTPWMGVTERINIYGYMLWLAALAIVLLRARSPVTAGRPPAGFGSPQLRPHRPAVHAHLARKGEIVTSLKALIQRHSVLTYYILTFVLSWGGILLVIGGPGAIPSPSEQAMALLPIAILMMIVGPSVAGLLLTGLVHGRAGLRDLWARLLKWRVGARWYVVALLTAPLLIMAILLPLSLFSLEYLPAVTTTGNKASLLMMGIMAGLAAGIFEEIGWTGFAIPKLRLRHSMLATGLTVGFLWGAWHLLVYIWGSGDASGAFSWALFLPTVPVFFGILPAFRVLMVWVYDHTESLLVAMLMHASLTASTQILMPTVIGIPGFIYSLILAAVLWVIVAVVAAGNRGQTARPPLRGQMA